MIKSEEVLIRRGAVKRLASLPLAVGHQDAIAALIERVIHDGYADLGFRLVERVTVDGCRLIFGLLLIDLIPSLGFRV
jgi:hypothetical protein